MCHNHELAKSWESSLLSILRSFAMLSFGCRFPDNCHLISPSEFRYIKGGHVRSDHKVCWLHPNGVHVEALNHVLSHDHLNCREETVGARIPRWSEFLESLFP